MANILTTHFSYTLAKPILSKCPLIIFGSNAWKNYILKASLLQKQKWFGLYMAIINPSRITIRPFKESDIDDVLLWLGDERVTENTRLETCNTKKEALDFITNECIYPIRQSICLDDHSIGMVWILPHANDEKHKADLGYAIGFNYWGQGIATNAVKILLSKVFHEFPDLRRLQAFTVLENISSQRVLEKVGFYREGMLRKVFYFKGNFVDFYIFSFLWTDEIPSVV